MQKNRKEKEHVLFSLFWEFLKIGLFTIGGGMAMIPLMTKITVEDKKWVTQEEMLDCIAISQSVPGVVAINTATFIGYRKAGFLGGLFATLGVITPSFIIILALANVINAINDNKFIQGAFIGIKACVTGLVLCVAYDIGKQTLNGWFHWFLAILAFVSVVIFKINAIIVVIVTGLLGAIYYCKKAEGKVNNE